MKKLLLVVGILLILTSCSSKPEQQILGKWEKSGVVTAEFTQETSVWIGAGCKHSGYKSEKKQMNGELFEFIAFTCKAGIPDGNPVDLTLNAILIDKNTIAFLSQEHFRVK